MEIFAEEERSNYYYHALLHENTIKPHATINWKTFIASPYVRFVVHQQPVCCQVQRQYCKYCAILKRAIRAEIDYS
ncbi:hypothetical protein T4E_7412 [Trichinella pseudospiralis]|uniref:Uncharacterized protein n=1 Tax=Trichinella pseudospiralis TaxID=6337 RepID=A0A0V0XW96_TRIPS|nr:hypothetical protein T4E_7412 [Trichinella pseudospiralis]